MKPTLILDFDGTITTYKGGGWIAPHVIPDLPTDGVREAIAKLREKYCVVVFSSRSRYPEGIQAMKAWRGG